jgi:hypothetical protein
VNDPSAGPAAAADWKIILSRKGFDSKYGRMPSPILPDGRLVPLPIPTDHDSFRFRDALPDQELEKLLVDLSGGRHDPEATVHLDPDLDRKPSLRLPGWRPALGQTGGPQSHLAKCGVGPGDVFLFFGWFRSVEQAAGRWRYAKRAPDLHVLFGWLEVDEVLPIVTQREACLAAHPWIANHPHVSNPERYSNHRNTLYIAPARSRVVDGLPGGGFFDRLSDRIRLTAAGESRSVWELPAWFMADRDSPPLSCHGNPARWQRNGTTCRLQSVPIGQEFVLGGSGRAPARSWTEDLIRQHARIGTSSFN